MKTIANCLLYAILFVLFFGAFMYGASRFGMFEVYDNQGNKVSTFPYSTETQVREIANRDCGQGCTVVRVYRK